MDYNFGEWVKSINVWAWLAGGGCGYWVESMGVDSECCKEVYRYPHNNYNFSLLHLY